MQETIVAVSSASGKAPRAVVRLSGEESYSIVKQLWQGPEFQSRSYECLEGRVELPSWQCSIEALLYLMKGPRSYTGEDSVEIHLLSSPIVLDVLLRHLVQCGARPAQAGEFTHRAFACGRIDLAQAEAVAALIAANDEAERRMAIFGITGVLSQQIDHLQQRLTRIIALVEAYIDFSDEEVPPLDPQEVIPELMAVAKELRQLSLRESHSQNTAINVCLYGLPNSGKSSLFNLLTGEKRALISDIPGTTLDWLEAEVQWDEMVLNFIDTPGLEELPQGLQQKAQQRVPELLKAAEIILYLVDTSRAFDQANDYLLAHLTAVPTLLVGSKSDLPGDTSLAALQERTQIAESLLVSTHSGHGVKQLKHWLMEKAYQLKSIRNPGLLNLRQYHASQQAYQLIEQAVEGLELGMSYEFVAADLRGALDQLGEIAGRVSSEDILGHIFSEFCIGK